MATALANIIPLTPTKTKIHFIGYNAPRISGLTSVSYGGNSFDVIDTGHDNNGWCVVDATFADFDNESRVVIEGDFPDPPNPPDPPENNYIIQFNGDNIETFSGDQTVLF